VVGLVVVEVDIGEEFESGEGIVGIHGWGLGKNPSGGSGGFGFGYGGENRVCFVRSVSAMLNPILVLRWVLLS